jgi:hypothetical protein
MIGTMSTPSLSRHKSMKCIFWQSGNALGVGRKGDRREGMTKKALRSTARWAYSAVRVFLQEDLAMEQSDVLMGLGKIGSALRGQLCEQWYEVTGKDGESRKTGPYYVLARCIEGKKTFARVPRDDAARVKEDLERGKTAAALISEFWRNAEALADEKKTAVRLGRRSSARNCVRPLRS